MASAKERAWLSAHQKGSRALVQRLDKVHANNPEYQAFKKTHGLENTSSVKQVSKSTVDTKKEKARQVLAGKAYGATKGTRMGSAEGTGETLRDTIAPLTRDQHSAVKAAEREAKAAEKPAAAPKKPAKPKKEKAAAPEKKKPSALELIAAAAAKRKINQPPVSAKALRRIAAVGDMEHDHGGFDDLSDTQYGSRGSYNEEVELKVGQHVKFKEPVSGTARHTRKPMSFDGGKVVQVTPTHAIVRPQAWHGDEGLDVHVPHKNIKEEVENFKVGDKVKMHTPDDLDWHKRKGELISTSDGGHVVKLNDGTKLSATKHQIKKIDEEVELDEAKKHPAHDEIVTRLKSKYGPGKVTVKKEVGWWSAEHTDKHGDSYAHRVSQNKAGKVTIHPSLFSPSRDEDDEEAELDEANSNPDMLAASRYGTTTTQAPKGTEKAYQKLLKRQIKNRMGLHRKPNLPEEVEQVDEASKPEYSPHAHSGYGRAIKPGTKIGIHQRPRSGKIGLGKINPAEVTEYHGQDDSGQHMYTVKQGNKTRNITSRSALIRTIKKPSVTKEEVEQIDEMKYGIGTVVKLKKPVDGHEYATVKGFTSSGSTSGPTGRGVPMPAGKVKKVKVALRKNDDHSYYAGPVTHIEHDDIHSVIRESAPGWMLRQNPELAKKVKARIAIAKNRKKQMGNPEPVKEAKKHHMGGALFADTAARLQKAVNAHKERMNQIENGPEDTYHHAGLNLTTKSRVKLPAPWAKVEDK